LIWKYVVEKMGPKFGYAGAIVYWRNKCLKEGIQLGLKHQTGGEGASFGPFKIKTGDQIEEWVMERLASEGLVSNAAKTAEEWKLEIAHLESAVQDAKQRIATHRAGLEKGSRVNQRMKWLAEAESDLAKTSKDLDLASKAVSELQSTAQRHETHQAPAIDFENQFQFAMQLATKALSKREILEQAKAAIAKFAAEVHASEMEDLITKEASVIIEGAAVTDLILGVLKKTWGFVQGAFARIVDWAKDLMTDTKKLSKILDQAGAKKA
jgi:hypothetical protein